MESHLGSIYESVTMEVVTIANSALTDESG